MSLGIVLVSGGLDSCVAAAIATHRGPLAFLHLRYRQRTEGREFAAFAALADHFQVETRLVVDVDYMRQIGGSSLTDATQPIPENDAAAGLPSTYVPFRNANLLGVAVAWAEVIGATDIYIGAHEAESHYPGLSARIFCRLRAHGRHWYWSANPSAHPNPTHRLGQSRHHPLRPSACRPPCT